MSTSDATPNSLRSAWPDAYSGGESYGPRLSVGTEMDAPRYPR
jgi:hypothetical protein